MNLAEAKELIIRKTQNFSETDRCIKSLERMWNVDEYIDFIQVNSEQEDYQVEHITISDGNLKIKGMLEDAVNDFSLLIVLGDLVLDRAIIMSEIFVTGNLIIKDTVVLDSQGDYGLHVGENITAKNFVELDHFINYSGKFTAENSFERGVTPINTLLDEFIEDEYPLFREIAVAIRETRAVFK